MNQRESSIDSDRKHFDQAAECIEQEDEKRIAAVIQLVHKDYNLGFENFSCNFTLVIGVIINELKPNLM